MMQTGGLPAEDVADFARAVGSTSDVFPQALQATAEAAAAKLIDHSRPVRLREELLLKVKLLGQTKLLDVILAIEEREESRMKRVHHKIRLLRRGSAKRKDEGGRG